jgi:RNA ligase
MQKFSSIEAFRHLIANVRRANVSIGLPLTTEEFEGTVKLHGTNAGVCVSPEKVQPQSRERLISIGSDNAGFAQFVAGREDEFRGLSDSIAGFNELPTTGEYTIFGEWCGGNIQSKVGLNAVERHFVVFNVFDHAQDKYLSRYWMRWFVANNESYVKSLNDAGIYFIYQIPTFKHTVDFTAPEQSIEELERLTLQVEEKCPWAAFRGAEGIGEGIVWVLTRDTADTRYWFKTKGVKHQGKDKSEVKTLSADPVKVGAIRELVTAILPEWRLEQGATYLRENGFNLDQRATGQFLQWINKDILKEEADQIAANAYDWKELSPYVNQKARDWYFTFLTKEACK